MLYAAKCYWPGVSRDEVETIGARIGRERSGSDPAYRGSLLFIEDELVLCLFEGTSRTVVKRVSEHLGIPCERVMASAWLDPHPTKGGLQ